MYLEDQNDIFREAYYTLQKERIDFIIQLSKKHFANLIESQFRNSLESDSTNGHKNIIIETVITEETISANRLQPQELKLVAQIIFDVLQKSWSFPFIKGAGFTGSIKMLDKSFYDMSMQSSFAIKIMYTV